MGEFLAVLDGSDLAIVLGSCRLPYAVLKLVAVAVKPVIPAYEQPGAGHFIAAIPAASRKVSVSASDGLSS